jgi:hypothetical protein
MTPELTKKLTRKSGFLLLAASALSLVACTAATGPHLMGSGYTYQGYENEYKAPPGPLPDVVVQKYTPKRNMILNNNWEVAVGDLVDQLLGAYGPPARPLFLRPRDSVSTLHQSPFIASFDNALREALVKRGVLIVTQPKDALILYYDVRVARDPLKEAIRDDRLDSVKVPDREREKTEPQNVKITSNSEAVLSLVLAEKRMVKDEDGDLSEKQFILAQQHGKFIIHNAAPTHHDKNGLLHPRRALGW